MLTLKGFYGREVKIPEGLLYFPEREVWVRLSGDGRLATIGLTHAAILLVSGITQVEYVVDVGQWVEEGDKIAYLETYKAIQDVDTPLPGLVVQLNEYLAADPSIADDSPYDEGWLFQLKLEGENSWRKRLVDASTYMERLGQSEHCGGSRPAWKPHCG